MQSRQSKNKPPSGATGPEAVNVFNSAETRTALAPASEQWQSILRSSMGRKACTTKRCPDSGLDRSNRRRIACRDQSLRLNSAAIESLIVATLAAGTAHSEARSASHWLGRDVDSATAKLKLDSAACQWHTAACL